MIPLHDICRRTETQCFFLIFHTSRRRHNKCFDVAEFFLLLYILQEFESTHSRETNIEPKNIDRFSALENIYCLLRIRRKNGIISATSELVHNDPVQMRIILEHENQECFFLL